MPDNLPLYKQMQKYVVGQKIVKVRLNRFRTMNAGMDNEYTYDPVIELENGVLISFLTIETETGEYGVDPIISLHNLKK